MLNKLPDTIISFSNTNRVNVNSLIREVKVGKIELQSLINNLKTFSSGSAFSTSIISPFSRADRALFVDLFRDSFFRIQKFYSAMNNVGLAINSMISIFSSEISKIEKDIENYEFFINNYNFLVGEDDLYNFNYIEKFNDLLGEYRFDGAKFAIPDRDNSTFPIGGNGFVDSSLGIFRFGSKIDYINIIDNIKSINVKTNFDNYISSNSDIENLFNETLLDSWNVTVKSPVILTSKLSEYQKFLTYDYSGISGAQVFVEIELINTIIIDAIRINSNFSSSFNLLQAVLFNGNDSYTLLLNEQSKIRGVKEIAFSKQPVSKVVLIFNQASYTRNKLSPISSEQNYKLVDNFVSERIRDRSKKFSIYQDLVYWFFNKKTTTKAVSNRDKEFDFYSFRFPEEKDSFEKLIQEELFFTSNTDINYNIEKYGSPVLINLIQNMLKVLDKDSKLVKNNFFIESRSNNSQRLLENSGFSSNASSNIESNIKDQFYNYPIVNSGVDNAIKSFFGKESVDFYEYQFSIKSIDLISSLISTETDPYKVCFVSKKLPSNGQVLGLKAKMDTVSVVESVSLNNYDLDEHISYEMSISNVEFPESESDWYPLGFDNQQSITSEVVFFDITNYSYKLRFNALEDTIFLYKDGILCNPYKYMYNRSDNKITLLDSDIFNPGSIFVVKYDLDLINYNPNEIDFVKQNILVDNIKPYTTNGNGGQFFRKNDSSNSVILDRFPYVNGTLILNSVYSKDFGTVFSVGTGYSPIRIRLNDGSFAINLTNYTNSPEKVSFYSSEIVQFIHSGRNIVFDRKIDSPFTVFYDYSPDILRFRLIARRNIPFNNAPIKVDSVLLKMKTQSYDSYYDKLNVSFTGN